MTTDNSEITINVRLKGDVSDQLDSEPNSNKWGFTVDDGDVFTYIEVGDKEQVEECIIKRDDNLAQLVFDGIRKSSNTAAHEMLDIVLEEERGLYINDEHVPHADLVEFAEEE